MRAFGIPGGGMDLSLRLDTDGFAAALSALADRDVRPAAAWALNDTAADVLAHVQGRMQVVFDRPTLFTQNAFMVGRARADRLEAVVGERPSAGARHYLKVQEAGGPRSQTGFEKLLSQKLAYAGVVQSIIPADNARLDAYGNWSRGERNQVLSALQAQGDAAANTAARSAARNRGRARYFVPKSGLTPGIYKRTAKGQLGIVAVISAKVPVYQQRLGFYEGAAEIWSARLPGHLARTLGRVMAKRLGQG